MPPHKRNEGVSNQSGSTDSSATKWVPPHLRGQSASSASSSSAAKWVPPHLRNSGSSTSSSDSSRSSSSSAAKWVPPHLRGNTGESSGSSTAKWVPPHLRGKSGTSSGSSTTKWVPPHRRGEADSSRSSPDRCSDSYDFDTDEDFLFEMDMPSSTPTPVSASSNAANQTTSNRRSPQLTETATSSHVGVTSVQGPRDKMEDFYVSLPTFGVYIILKVFQVMVRDVYTTSLGALDDLRCSANKLSVLVIKFANPFQVAKTNLFMPFMMDTAAHGFEKELFCTVYCTKFLGVIGG